ncbi:hypothetical protein HMPREF0083_02390 [Aneurinibacillus aneurinilyticus ATCC 12856]|uniref:Uncharacterized protein n=1 Tax=Aneurinibacillus aneurinilyticus ATCC 12856 TaxID=649747 RepID=U1WLS7_ANEAE|nr:hypothetical protein HMPREF0083_02390 [Aneurinibacillus aneurinilyticus ATCC 12856]
MGLTWLDGCAAEHLPKKKNPRKRGNLAEFEDLYGYLHSHS